MNFFEHQDKARKRTGRLIFLFFLAVLTLISLTSLVLLFFLNGGEVPWLTREPRPGDWKILINVSLTVLLLVVFGSLFKQLQLNAGGEVVAQALGGRCLSPNTRDPEERRLINLVEEMALASGSPVPPVYLLEDSAINAFAAGYSPQDAVIGVTRGALQQLSRDELQGVIAHEFSHIFNGDMRLNLRLVALLHGILLIGLGGRLLLHSMGGHHLRSSSRSGRATAGIALLGVLLLAIGSIGLFFGKLIKAAVSRQREFLADASAVQFTRNPQGIAGALNKIAKASGHSQLGASHKEEFSHLFFSNALESTLAGFLATHPPLDERIQRINAGPLNSSSTVSSPAAASSNSHKEEEIITRSPAGAYQGLAVATAAQVSIESMGQPQLCHLQQARQTLNALDPQLLEAAHEPWTARALVYGLLLSEDAEVRARQLALLNEQAAPESLQALDELKEPLQQVSAAQRLPLAELSLPALKYLTPEQKKRFYACMALLIRADKRLSLFEWSLARLIKHSLEPPSRMQRQKQLHQLQEPLARVLSLIVWLSAKNQQAAQKSFRAAQEELGFSALKLFPKNELQLKQLDACLQSLNELRALQKPRLLKALARAITADREISRHQVEIFRVLGVTLDCPLPPLVLVEAGLDKTEG